MALATGMRGHVDPVEVVAQVAAARRELLLRVHRRRLRHEDLEDCYSQATLELLARARRTPFESPAHVQNALEQKFLSRINDRRRALGGRSAIEAALAGAVSVDAPDAHAARQVPDPGAEVLRQVTGRLEIRSLRELCRELTDDQRLVLACQSSLGMECQEFCDRFGWSAEKFRKVAQRGRARLRVLVSEQEAGERCRRLAKDIDAVSAGVASQRQIELVGAHVENCRACARTLHELDRAARRVAALLPLPLGTAIKVGGLLEWLRRLVAGSREAGVAGVAGGTGAGAVKLGAAAACMAGAAACVHGGLLAGKPAQHSVKLHRAVRAAPPPTAMQPMRTARPRQRQRSHRPSARRRISATRPRAHITARQDFGFEVHVRRAARAAVRPVPAKREFTLEH